MADFYEIARERIKDLSSKKASVRRDAAYYLGEAGVDESITKLRTVYQSDPDPSVRKAAEYSLGMFRAIQEALEHGEQDKVVALLKRVVDDGKFGSRKKTPTAVLVVVTFLLLLIFIGLVGEILLMQTLKPL
jgi:HEAT repeat protein